MKINITKSEEEECKMLVEYLDTTKKYTYSHIAQSTYTNSWKVKNRNKAMGVRSGVPDYIIIKNKTLIFIEMKREKGGTVSPSQQEWINALNKCKKIKASVCNGVGEAINLLENI